MVKDETRIRRRIRRLPTDFGRCWIIMLTKQDGFSATQPSVSVSVSGAAGLVLGQDNQSVILGSLPLRDHSVL